MKSHRILAIALFTLLLSTAALAQEAPPGVSVGQSKQGAIYVDSRGMTLYALNQNQARSRSGVSLKYCVGPCAEIWTPLAAPDGAVASGAWSVVAGAQGPQWAYKGNPVFTNVKDMAPGSMVGDGVDDLWKAIAYIPPAPALVAPATVTALFADNAYILADGQGHALYTAKDAGKCAAACAAWTAFAAGMASQSVGNWSVSRDGDRPQWIYRGKAVFVSQDVGAPAGGVVLRP